MVLALSLLAVATTIAFGQPGYGTLLPDPGNDHPFKVAVSHFSLTDNTPRPSYASGTPARTIMASLFMPVARDACASECRNIYMPGKTARASDEQFILNTTGPVFGTMEYNACCGNKNSTIDASKLKVVVLEPQVDTSRLLYVNMARFISANGVVVILLDHPGDSRITEFDGKGSLPTIYNNGTVPLSNLAPLTAWNKTVVDALDTRIADIQFALRRLAAMDLQSFYPTLTFNSSLDTQYFAAIGHGFGGTIATTLSLTTNRTRFSINLSGSPPGYSSYDDMFTMATTYFFGRSDYTRADDFAWPRLWPQLTGIATEFDLANSAIFDFSDLPVVVEVARTHGKEGVRGAGARGIAPAPTARANQAMLCFVEALVREKLLMQERVVQGCLRLFPEMTPYAR
ncbi:hypothetical protein IAQ61_005347 [Plenodomus lingam]|uniref:uncharacterized protein n=1 Tax=Leptosphaeria maculans TaxID=5022 RepID=UPI00331A2090|nr:hypothetical protein IAQ61_005347 [Plenodomus lingam]